MFYVTFWGRNYKVYSVSWVEHIPRIKHIRVGMEVAVRTKIAKNPYYAIVLDFNWNTTRTYPRIFTRSETPTNKVAIASLILGKWYPDVVSRQEILCSWPTLIGCWHTAVQQFEKGHEC